MAEYEAFAGSRDPVIWEAGLPVGHPSCQLLWVPKGTSFSTGGDCTQKIQKVMEELGLPASAHTDMPIGGRHMLSAKTNANIHIWCYR